tara:strand:+ start:252 stop:863 length:612 start_codon:yes stop_codon:yes gene_type:complete
LHRVIKISFFKQIIGFIIWFTVLFPQVNQIKTLNLESKVNGIMILMELDTLPDLANITGWQANSGWFYITLYQFKGDSSKLIPKILNNSIRDFQFIQTNESIQLGIRLNNPIQNHEFSLKDEKNTLVATLHYSTEYLAQSDTIKQMELEKPKNIISDNFKNWLYITSTGLTAIGILNSFNDNIDHKTTIGLGILIFTFILDKI